MSDVVPLKARDREDTEYDAWLAARLCGLVLHRNGDGYLLADPRTNFVVRS
jgi:hypothetical protein